MARHYCASCKAGFAHLYQLANHVCQADRRVGLGGASLLCTDCGKWVHWDGQGEPLRGRCACRPN